MLDHTSNVRLGLFCDQVLDCASSVRPPFSGVFPGASVRLLSYSEQVLDILYECQMV